VETKTLQTNLCTNELIWPQLAIVLTNTLKCQNKIMYPVRSSHPAHAHSARHGRDRPRWECRRTTQPTHLPPAPDLHELATIRHLPVSRCFQTRYTSPIYPPFIPALDRHRPAVGDLDLGEAVAAGCPDDQNACASMERQGCSAHLIEFWPMYTTRCPT
jgi:hypothetical protein